MKEQPHDLFLSLLNVFTRRPRAARPLCERVTTDKDVTQSNSTEILIVSLGNQGHLVAKGVFLISLNETLMVASWGGGA